MGKVKKVTQAERVLKLMQNRKRGITALQALEFCGCFDLAGRIRDLKEDGYPIIGDWVYVTNRFGEKVRIKQYRLVEFNK